MGPLLESGREGREGRKGEKEEGGKRMGGRDRRERGGKKGILRVVKYVRMKRKKEVSGSNEKKGMKRNRERVGGRHRHQVGVSTLTRALHEDCPWPPRS